MVHKEQYQKLADEAAMQRRLYASHIGKVGDDTFVYSLIPPCSADSHPEDRVVATVSGDTVTIYEGDAAQQVLAQTNLREFSTGRAIFKKYQTLVKNKSAIIGEGPLYAEAIVNAGVSKAVRTSLLYQYLEIAEHYHKKLRITGADICLV